MSGVPKSLKDFKKASSNNMQNTILGSKSGKQGQPHPQPQNLSLDDVMSPPQGQQRPPQMGGFPENPYQEQFRPQPEFMGQPEFNGQGDFPQALKPNFNDAYNSANVSEIQMPEIPQNTSNFPTGEMENGMNPQNHPFQPLPHTNVNVQQPMEQTPPMENVPPMEQPNLGMPIPNQPVVQEVLPKYVEERKVEKPMMREELKVQPYQQIQLAPMQEKKANNKNIVAHVQEIEAEIDGLVNNTQAFLNNTKVLKIQILQAKTREELAKVMKAVQETLNDIPESFINPETRRRLRLCFSYLHKTKKELLDMEDQLRETQESLERLVSIDDIQELEETILDIPATPTTDNVYEIRTFEINLVGQLPSIKDDLLRERLSAVYSNF